MTDLTEEFFNNTLDPSEEYYIKLDNGAVVTDNAYVDGNEVVFMNHKKHEIEKVLTLVPSYLELKRLESDSLAKNEGIEIVAELKEENARLKNQNKRLRDIIKTCMRYLDNQSVTDVWADNIKMDINDEMGDLGMEKIDD